MQNYGNIHKKFVASAFIASSGLFMAVSAFAWTDPGQVPPAGNVSTPLNVGTTDQYKNATLGAYTLNIFGVSQYLNFGTTIGTSGFGFRNNAGVIEFKNSGGTWAALGSGGGSNQWTTNGSNISYSTGNVSIGSTVASNRLVIGDDSTGATGAPGSTLSVGSALTNSVITIGQSSTARSRYAWIYNATPSSAYAVLGDAQGAHPLVLQDQGGSVGIGITAPNINSIGVGLHINSTGTDAGGISEAALHLTNGTTGSASANGLLLARWPDGNVYFWNYESSPILFGTASAERMRISAAGNVGIGLSNPISRLHVGASSSGLAPYPGWNSGLTMAETLQQISASTTSTTTTYTGLNLENSSQTNNTYSPFISFSRKSDSGAYNMPYASIGAIRTAAGGDTNWNAGDLLFGTEQAGTYGVTEKMRITGAGNVGIGTASPGNTLDVNGTLKVRGAGIYNNAGSQIIETNATDWTRWNQGSASTNGNAMYQSLSLGSGGLAVGTWSNQAVGNIYATGNVTAAGYFHTSDVTLKKNIVTSPGLSLITKLRGVTFNWKKSGEASSGFVAQEVEKVLPYTVHTDKEGIKSVDYDQLVAPLVEAVKEQQLQIEELRHEIAILKERK